MQLIIAIAVVILLSHPGPALLMHLLLHWRRRNIADGGGGAFFLFSNALFVGCFESCDGGGGGGGFFPHRIAQQISVDHRDRSGGSRRQSGSRWRDAHLQIFQVSFRLCSDIHAGKLLLHLFQESH